MPSSRRTSASASPSGAGSRPSRWSAALDDRYRRPEAGDSLGHLDADRPAAEHEQATGDRLHPRDLAVRPDPVELSEARDRRDDRVGARRHHDMSRGVPRAVDLDHANPRQPTRAAEQINALALQPALLAGVGVVGDHEVPPRQRGLDIDLGGSGGVTCGVHGLTGTQQGLGGDAGPVRALAADKLSLDQGDPQTPLGQLSGAVLPRRAGTDHDDVVVRCHVGSSCPACSRTMYSAYQSGQSASACPVRAS